MDLGVQAADELLDLVLHLLHPLAHVEDDLDPRQIHTQVAGQFEDHLQALQVLVGVEPGIAVAAGGLQQSFTLIQLLRLVIN